MPHDALTFSDWASKDFRLFVTFFSSSSRSLALLRRGKTPGWFSKGKTRVGMCACVCLLVSPFRELSSLLSSLQLSLQDHQLAGNLGKKKRRQKFEANHKKQNVGKIWTPVQSGLSSEHCPILTSSYLRSASSAMCFASFSCISWISIFSSSFIARFSITFIPLIGHQHVRISHSRGVSKIQM